MKKKRILIGLIVSILAITGIIINMNVKKQNEIAIAAAKETTQSDIAFAVLGDVHNNIDSFQEAIDDLHEINPKMDALILNGDAVDQGNENQYESVKNFIDKNNNLLPNKIIKNIGNHDFFDYDAGTNSKEQVQTFIKRYLEFAGEEKVYHDT